MEPFKSEIRNTPARTTIKIFLADETLDSKLKDYLEEYFEEIDFIEIRETIGQNRSNENLTVFLKASANINVVKDAIDTCLINYFEQESMKS